MKKVLLLTLFVTAFAFNLKAQVYEYVNNEGQTHRILKTDTYLVETIFEKDPAKFVLTRGGFINKVGEDLEVVFEFNSDYNKDQMKTYVLTDMSDWKQISLTDQELESTWLFATRVRNGEMSKRRGEESTRKTLKFLKDGYFQWIAYDTNGMKFMGSGGGTYTAKDGTYIETIQYFSKDNSRVGAVLSFDYEVKGNDWHHKGLSSKGDPIHEVWAKR